jgi:hypothetical protein
MKTEHAPQRFWFRTLALALIAGAVALQLHAQNPGTGTIQGRVFNPVANAYAQRRRG